MALSWYDTLPHSVVTILRHHRKPQSSLLSLTKTRVPTNFIPNDSSIYYLFQSMFNLLRLVNISWLLMASVASSTNRIEIEGVPLLLFRGTLLNDLGAAVEGADVQFWQTDPNGVYDPPGAQGANALVGDFQYFGTAKTLGDGSFWFLTHRPGIYTGRPTHFHYKIWVDGENILTSQFYFADENTQYSDMQQKWLHAVKINSTLIKTVSMHLQQPHSLQDRIQFPFFYVGHFLFFAIR
jgi:protocatechuate 3,4-dioxygenase beta subunit